MVERAGGMAFAAGALVFPGGRIDEADRQLGGELGVDPAAVAAIRETIEETAVPVGISPVPDHASMCGLQDALVAERPFGELLNQHGLRLDAAALTPFARWVPKFHAVRRFDTLFFIARCSAGDGETRVIEGECSAAAWITAAEVLERDCTRRSPAHFSDAANSRTARPACQFRRYPRRCARAPDRTGNALGRGSRRRTIHYDPGPSRLSGDAGKARRPLARLTACSESPHRANKKGTRRSGSPSVRNLPKFISDGSTDACSFRTC